MTTTHDTAAALEAAIRTFGVCAYSPSEPSDPYGIAGAHIWIEIEDYAAPLKAAITAHVEAEVARRLAAAPDVEAAIEAHGDVCYERGFRHALKSDAVDSELDAAYDRLRAAIAADKARAVEAAEDAAFLRGRDAVRKYPDGWGLIARPTPNEAHRMINELIGATAIIGNGLDDDPGTVVAKRIAKDARTALLRALGVEA